MKYSIETLKETKVGDSLLLISPTGENLGTVKVLKANDTKIMIIKKDGRAIEFSRETGIQLEPRTPEEAYKIADLAEDVQVN